MHLLINTFLFLASVLPLALSGSIIADPRFKREITVLKTLHHANTTITVYGVPPTSPLLRIAAVSRLPADHCGQNNVHCDYENNLAEAWRCEEFWGKLQNDPYWEQRFTVNPGSTGFCNNNPIEHKQCCVTWQQPIRGEMHAWYLLAAATKTFEACRNHEDPEMVSGWASEVLLGDVCQNQCLSSAGVC